MTERSVWVVGGGTMGSGIAQVAASAGWAVRLTDSFPGALQRAEAQIKKNLDRQVEAGRLPSSERERCLQRIRFGEDGDQSGDFDLVVEAIIEDLGVKQQIFREIEATTKVETVLATNTSSLSVGRIAEGLRNPQRMIGMHFFNPAPLMPLVEIIAGPKSDPQAVAIGGEIARGWGKVTVFAKDTPGFIVNRVARGFYLEALRLLDEGVGGIDEIDSVMRNIGGFKMGPFQLMDLVGLDVNLAVSTSVWEQMGKPDRLQPHPIQQRLVAKGDHGRKTNRGFYAYSDGTVLPVVSVHRQSFRLNPLLREAVRAFTQRSGAANASETEQYIFARILAAILNEAGWARRDEVATAADIDLAMMKGTNYPKGPLAWADTIGFNTVRGVLSAFCESLDDGRYEPAPLFRS